MTGQNGLARRWSRWRSGSRRRRGGAQGRLAPGLARARLRLTALYAALFAGSGGGLLLVVNLLARRSLPDVLFQATLSQGGQTVRIGSGDELTEVPVEVPGEGVLTDLRPQNLGSTGLDSPVEVWVQGGSGSAPGPGTSGRIISAANAATVTTAEYLRWSLLVFAVLLAASIILGYVLSGRVLAPIQRSFESERRLVATMSHELRTPLATQRALLETALPDTALPDTALPDTAGALAPGGSTDQVGSVVEAGRQALEQNIRAGRIIDAMLLLARVDRDRAEALVTMTEVDLAGIVKQVLAERADQARARGLDLRVDVPEQRLVRGDPVLLERLVDNLVANAIVHNVADGWVRVEVSSVGGATHFSVGNSGAIIDPADAGPLIQPFRRGSKDRTGSARGSGLGLTIANEVAEAHSGSLSLAANPGGGLTATVVLS